MKFADSWAMNVSNYTTQKYFGCVQVKICFSGYIAMFESLSVTTTSTCYCGLDTYIFTKGGKPY
jgi:hypothetical protein